MGKRMALNARVLAREHRTNSTDHRVISDVSSRQDVREDDRSESDGEYKERVVS